MEQDTHERLCLMFHVSSYYTIAIITEVFSKMVTALLNQAIFTFQSIMYLTQYGSTRGL